MSDIFNDITSTTFLKSTSNVGSFSFHLQNYIWSVLWMYDEEKSSLALKVSCSENSGTRWIFLFAHDCTLFSLMPGDVPSSCLPWIPLHRFCHTTSQTSHPYTHPSTPGSSCSLQFHLPRSIGWRWIKTTEIIISPNISGWNTVYHIVKTCNRLMKKMQFRPLICNNVKMKTVFC